MRLVYGAPPVPSSEWLRRVNDALAQMPEEHAREMRLRYEYAAFGRALFNLIAPVCGEEPLRD